MRLLEKTLIEAADQKELVQNYFNDERVRSIVQSFADIANLVLYESSYEDYVCILPKSPRSIFAYSKTDIIARYGLDGNSYLLFMFYTFCILHIVNEFGENNFKVEKIYEVANEKIEKIKEDIKKENTNEKYNWNFDSILKIWEEMREMPHATSSEIRSSQKTKLGMLKKTVQILHEERILEFIEGNINAVKTTEKTNAILFELSKDETYNLLKAYFLQ